MKPEPSKAYYKAARDDLAKWLAKYCRDDEHAARLASGFVAMAEKADKEWARKSA